MPYYDFKCDKCGKVVTKRYDSTVGVPDHIKCKCKKFARLVRQFPTGMSFVINKEVR